MLASVILTVRPSFAPYPPVYTRRWLLTSSIGIAQTTAEEDEEESDDE